MDHSIEQATLLPWHSIITWAGGITLVLLLVLIVLPFFTSKKKDVEERIDNVARYIFLAFIISAMLSNITAFCFLVSACLGWKFSLSAGGAMILSAFSMVRMLIEVFHSTSMKILYLWTFWFVLSFASLIYLFVISLGR